MKAYIVLAVTLLAVVLIACGQQGAEPEATTTTRMPAKAESTEKVLAAYESLRSQLAKDEMVSAGDFEGLADAARAASENYSGEAKTHLEELARAAESRASQADEGLPQAREAFGEVSRHLIALLSADPELARGRYVLECPMAKNYPKWVQQSETVSNPYMGPEMATCGVASNWQP